MLLLLVLFLLLGFFTSGNEEQKASKDDIGIKNMTEQEFEEMTPGDVPEPELEEWVIQQSPPCEEREGDVAKDYCYREMALREENTDYCEKIVDSMTESSCYSGVASITGDSSLCHRNEGLEEKNACFYSAAIPLENPFICLNITEELKKKACLGKVFQNVLSLESCARLSEVEELCLLVEGQVKEDCLDRMEECREET